MKKLVFAAAVGALVLASAPSALAGPSRADSYYTVHCIVGGIEVLAESVDARAIEQGGKNHAIDNCNANHPDWFCWAERAFNT
jgi:hypothetical protein